MQPDDCFLATIKKAEIPVKGSLIQADIVIKGQVLSTGTGGYVSLVYFKRSLRLKCYFLLSSAAVNSLVTTVSTFVVRSCQKV